MPVVVVLVVLVVLIALLRGRVVPCARVSWIIAVVGAKVTPIVMMDAIVPIIVPTTRWTITGPRPRTPKILGRRLTSWG